MTKLVLLLALPFLADATNQQPLQANTKVLRGSNAERFASTQDKRTIVGMQWSAHWMCFAPFGPGPECNAQVTADLPTFLANGGNEVDFANLGMFQDTKLDPWKATVQEAAGPDRASVWLQREWDCALEGNGLSKDECNGHPDIMTLKDTPVAWAPEGYTATDLYCSADNIKFLYNSNKWEPVVLEGGLTNPLGVMQPIVAAPLTPLKTPQSVPKPISTYAMHGCFQVNAEGGPDRVYIIMALQRILPKGAPSDKVLVVGAHFPHPPGGTSSSDISVEVDTSKVMKLLGEKINAIQAANPDINNVMLIGDLNNDVPGKTQVGRTYTDKDKGAGTPVPVQPCLSNEKFWAAMSLTKGGTLVSSTEAKNTCCADKMDAATKMFPYAFDRIVANFGTMTTTMPLATPATATAATAATDTAAAKPATAAQTEEELKAAKEKYFIGAFHKPIIGTISY